MCLVSVRVLCVCVCVCVCVYCVNGECVDTVCVCVCVVHEWALAVRAVSE